MGNLDIFLNILVVDTCTTNILRLSHTYDYTQNLVVGDANIQFVYTKFSQKLFDPEKLSITINELKRGLTMDTGKLRQENNSPAE